MPRYEIEVSEGDGIISEETKWWLHIRELNDMPLLDNTCRVINHYIGKEFDSEADAIAFAHDWIRARIEV